MDKKEAYHKLAMLCSRKEYCISDLHKKFRFWELSSTQENEIIKQLISEKYVDEERYTEAFVKDKFRFNKWGKQKISYHLKQKQVPQECIDTAIANISDEDYFQTIEQLLQSKNKNVKAKDLYDRRAKLFRFMAQRGFGLDAVNMKLDDLLSED